MSHDSKAKRNNAIVVPPPVPTLATSGDPGKVLGEIEVVDGIKSPITAGDMTRVLTKALASKARQRADVAEFASAVEHGHTALGELTGDRHLRVVAELRRRGTLPLVGVSGAADS
jgi:hypothetical protein